jgi:chromosome segregation ATPase
MGDEEPLSLDEVLAQLEAEELEEKEKIEKMEEGNAEELEEKKEDGDDEDLKEKVDKMEEELEEAQDAIITLNETLKELNLLNAKLLFANKILRAKTLSESEKSRVIRAFDRTKSVKETKNTYNTLMESFTKKPKTQIKESIGFASKPTGVASKTSNPIVESDGFIDRWKVIAGIK